MYRNHSQLLLSLSLLDEDPDIYVLQFLKVCHRAPYDHYIGAHLQIVHIVKDNEPLGATIKVNERTGAVLIARVMHGGAADRCGYIFISDRGLG